MAEDLEATTATHLQELRRGTVVLAALLALREPGYGYSLLEDLNDEGFKVDGNTLYPLLRRLEKQGLLVSEWNTDDTRPRKFYRTSPQGRAIAETLLTDWAALDISLRRLSGAPAPDANHSTNASTNPDSTPSTNPEKA